jgi:hypothetical protein
VFLVDSDVVLLVNIARNELDVRNDKKVYKLITKCRRTSYNKGQQILALSVVNIYISYCLF